MIDNTKEYILCAAVKRLDGGFDCGYRHNDVYEKAFKKDIEEIYGIDFYNDMGFLTSKGRFVGRREAYKIALECGQINKRDPDGDKTMAEWLGLNEEQIKKGLEWLASEDLY